MQAALRICLLFTSVLLAGCAGFGDFFLVSATARALLDDRYPVDRTQIEESPYAALGARFGNGPRVVLNLAQADGQGLHWIGQDNIVVVTRHGLVVQTVGLPCDIRAVQLEPHDVFRGGLLNLGTAYDNSPRIADFVPGERGVLLSSRLSAPKDENITILDSKEQPRQPVIATNAYRRGAQGWRMILHHAAPGPAAEEPAAKSGQLH